MLWGPLWLYNPIVSGKLLIIKQTIHMVRIRMEFVSEAQKGNINESLREEGARAGFQNKHMMKTRGATPGSLPFCTPLSP